METFHLLNDLQLFGNEVKTFPQGIKEAFDTLVAMLPDGLQRPYYGVSRMAGENILYYAMAGESFPGESMQYKCDAMLSIEKGDYLTITVRDWMSKTDTIKNVFGEIMRDNRSDKEAWCIEWYKSDNEMVCMIRKNAVHV